MTVLYDLLYALALVLGWPFLILRRIRRGPGSIALGDRLGNVPPLPGDGGSIWIHGVSVGEIDATPSLVSMLQARRPDLTIVISTTTSTGLARARQLYPDLTVFRFPLDFSFVLRKVIRRLRPQALILMELETWPNLLEVATQVGLPVVIANGRVTEGGSMRSFRKPVLRGIARRMFGRVTWVAAQEAVYAERFIELGVPAARVEVVGSVKFDTADVADTIPGQDELAEALGLDPARPLLVCGSTGQLPGGPAEEDLLLDVYQRLRQRHPTLQLALIPRKPERFDFVAERIAAAGLTCWRRTSGEARRDPDAIILGDTMGELRKFYALADVVFVGRTLVPMGGSNVIEVAGLARPLLVGPHNENFAEPVRILSAAGACVVAGGVDELARELDRLLADATARRAMGQRARETVLAQRGATERIVARVLGEMAAE